MRIAFVNHKLALTHGSSRRIIELSNSLTALGHDVTIYAKSGQKPEWIPLFAPVKLPSERTGSYDLALFNNSSPEELDLVKSIEAKVSAFYVVGWHEIKLDQIERRIKGGDPDRKIRMIRTVFDDPGFLILACSTWIGDHLRERYRKDVEVLLGGINREHFRPHAKPVTLRIGYSGDPRPRKGTKVTAKAIVRAMRRLKVTGIVRTYWGQGLDQKQMGRWYSAATIFADGQLWAGWNNPVLEAMACKTPVVCTDIGGVRDFAFHGETALLVPPHDIGAMTEALMRLAKDPALRDRLAQNAYATVAQFTWERTARRLVELVEERL